MYLKIVSTLFLPCFYNEVQLDFFLKNEQKVMIYLQNQRKPGSDKILPIDVPDDGGSKPVRTEPDPKKPNIAFMPVTTL